MNRSLEQGYRLSSLVNIACSSVRNFLSHSAFTADAAMAESLRSRAIASRRAMVGVRGCSWMLVVVSRAD